MVVRETGDRIGLLVFGEDVSKIVHDGDAVDRETFNRIGHKEADGVDRARRQLAVAAHAHEDGGGGLLLIVHEQTVLRHDDHDAGVFDLIDLADGTGQFTLHGAQVIGALHEVGDAEVGLVENLEAHALAAGNALGRHLGAHRIDLVGRHENAAAAAAACLVGDFRIVERGHDLGGLGVIKLAVEQRVFGAARPDGEADQARQHHARAEHEADALVKAELFPGLGQVLRELAKGLGHSE